MQIVDRTFYRNLNWYLRTLLLVFRNEDDALLTSFNVYMQIVVSQALEAGFLQAITQEKGTQFRVISIIRCNYKNFKNNNTVVSDLNVLFEEHLIGSSYVSQKLPTFD